MSSAYIDGCKKKKNPKNKPFSTTQNMIYFGRFPHPDKFTCDHFQL